MNKISDRSGQYYPVTPLPLEILRLDEFSRRAKGVTEAAIEMHLAIKIPKKAYSYSST